jgi:hypothetical protein
MQCTNVSRVMHNILRRDTHQYTALWTEYFDTRRVSAYNHVQDKQLNDNEFYSRIWQHPAVNSMHNFMLMATIQSFNNLFLTPNM